MANIISPVYKSYNGYSYKPGNPAFHAFTSSNSVGQGYINYDTEYFDIGNNFSSGRFFAPITGIYLFYWGTIGGTTSGTYRLRLVRNSSQYGWNNTNGDVQLRVQVAASTSYETNTSRIFIHELDRFDTVDVLFNSSPSSSTIYGGEYTYFGGYLLQ